MRFVALAVLVGLSAAARLAVGTEEKLGAWTMAVDDKGHVVSMSYPNPPTTKGSIQLLEFDVSGTDTPKTGHIKYKDGSQRSMPKEEIAYFFGHLGGPQAIWDHLTAKNEVTRYWPTTRGLPTSVSGKPVRVILLTGANFSGTISIDSAKPGGFHLAVEGGRIPIRFEYNAVSEVQVAK